LAVPVGLPLKSRERSDALQLTARRSLLASAAADAPLPGTVAV